VPAQADRHLSGAARGQPDTGERDRAHPLGVLPHQRVVERREHRPRVPYAHRDGAHGVAHEAGQGGSGHALAHDVPDDHHPVAGCGREDVVEVAAHLVAAARGPVDGPQVQPGHVRQNHRHRDLAHLVLHLQQRGVAGLVEDPVAGREQLTKPHTDQRGVWPVQRRNVRLTVTTVPSGRTDSSPHGTSS
jgi:hypothetical protein